MTPKTGRDKRFCATSQIPPHKECRRQIFSVLFFFSLFSLCNWTPPNGRNKDKHGQCRTPACCAYLLACSSSSTSLRRGIAMATILQVSRLRFLVHVTFAVRTLPQVFSITAVPLGFHFGLSLASTSLAGYSKKICENKVIFTKIHQSYTSFWLLLL